MEAKIKTQISPCLRDKERILDMDFLQTLLFLVVINPGVTACELLCFDLTRSIEMWRVDTLYFGEIQKNHTKNEILVANLQGWNSYSYDGTLIKEMVFCKGGQYPCRAPRLTTFSASSLSDWKIQEWGRSHYGIEKEEEEEGFCIPDGRWYLPEGLEPNVPVYQAWSHSLFVYQLSIRKKSLCFQAKIVFDYISDLLFLPNQKALLIFDSEEETLIQMNYKAWRQKGKYKRKRFKTFPHRIGLEHHSKLRLWNDKFLCLLTSTEKLDQKISLYDCSLFQ